jgi:chromosome segregation ATPase
VKRRRYDRERAAVQREIDRLQEQAGERYEEEIVTLWTRKKELLQRIEALDGEGSTVASGSFKKQA